MHQNCDQILGSETMPKFGSKFDQNFDPNFGHKRGLDRNGCQKWCPGIEVKIWVKVWVEIWSKFGVKFWPNFGPKFRVKIWVEIWSKFGVKFWPNFGPKFRVKIWGQNLGPNGGVRTTVLGTLETVSKHGFGTPKQGFGMVLRVSEGKMSTFFEEFRPGNGPKPWFSWSEQAKFGVPKANPR